MRPYLWPIQALLGAVLFAAVTFGFIFLVLLLIGELFDARMIPKGLGWIVLPFLAGTLGWRMGAHFGIESVFSYFKIRVENANRLARYWVASCALWFVSAVFYLFVFKPYGSYVTEDDYIHFFFVLVGPMFIGALAVFLFGWANREPT
jgi:hypothetical protein